MPANQLVSTRTGMVAALFSPPTFEQAIQVAASTLTHPWCTQASAIRIVRWPVLWFANEATRLRVPVERVVGQVTTPGWLGLTVDGDAVRVDCRYGEPVRTVVLTGKLTGFSWETIRQSREDVTAQSLAWWLAHMTVQADGSD